MCIWINEHAYYSPERRSNRQKRDRLRHVTVNKLRSHKTKSDISRLENRRSLTVAATDAQKPLNNKQSGDQSKGSVK